jgi:hypothetical protein
VISRATSDALERIAQRAQDALAAFTPGSVPARGATVGPAPRAQFSLDPLSVAAPRDAFFVTASADGSPRYTRDGSFTLRENALVASDGSPVLGYAGASGPGTLPAPLHIDPSDAALARHADLHLDATGALTYTRPTIDPRTGARTNERIIAGRIALARFPAGTAPARIDGTHVAAPAGVLPHLGTPGDATFGGLTTNARDGGGIDIDTALDRLADAYTTFSAMRAAFGARGATDRTATELVK